MSHGNHLFDLVKKLQSQDSGGREDAAEELGQLFERVSLGEIELEQQDYESIVKEVLKLALNETDPEVKEALFFSLVSAANMVMGETINWDQLAAAVEGIEDANLLECAVTVLGFARKKEYGPIIRNYINHPDPDVSQAAKEALIELEGKKDKEA